MEATLAYMTQLPQVNELHQSKELGKLSAPGKSECYIESNFREMNL